MRCGSFGLLLALVALLVGAASASNLSRPFTINGDLWLGEFRIYGDGTLYSAIRVFGEPSSVRELQSSPHVVRRCIVTWRVLGLTTTFYGGSGRNQSGCKPQFGCLERAIITGRQWRTTKGIRIGDPREFLFARYPAAPWRTGGRDGEWYWLILRPYHGTGTYPAFAAKLHNGWVTAFRIIARPC
jgi:hypothetical protein